MTLKQELFFLQLLNLTTIFENCVDDVDRLFRGKTVRIVILQMDDYRRELKDFQEILIERIHLRPSFKKVVVEEKFLPDQYRDYLKLGHIKSHVIIVWNLETLVEFLKNNKKTVIPFARHVYKIFIINSNSMGKKFLKNFFNDFGVLDICFCEGGNHYTYSPFTRNIDGTWGSTTIHERLDLKNFNQFPLKISMFFRQPTALKFIPKILKYDSSYRNMKINNKTFSGVDGFLLTTLAHYLNFNVDVVDDFGGENFGWVTKNGTATGSLGLVTNHKVHIHFNGRFVYNYGTKEIEFTAPYDTDEICVVVPKSQKVPQWLSAFNCFSKLTWLLMYIVWTTSFILWYFFRGRKFSSCFWEMYCIIRNIPIKIVPKTMSQTIFLIFCLIFAALIQSMIQGSLVNFFTQSIYYEEINTLEDLDESDLPIATNFFKFDSEGSKLIQSLSRKRLPSKPNTFDLIAYKRNMAKIERKRDLEKYILTHFLDDEGIPLLHIVNECLSSYFVAYVVPKGSALLEIFDGVIMRLVEAGLPRKWYDDVEFSFRLEEYLKLDKSKTAWKSFVLYDVQFAFFIWIFGVIIASGILFWEIINRKKYVCLTRINRIRRKEHLSV